MFRTFTAVLSKVYVQCPMWLFFVVLCSFQVCCSGLPGITLGFMFHRHWIFIAKFLYFKIFWLLSWSHFYKRKLQYPLTDMFLVYYHGLLCQDYYYYYYYYYYYLLIYFKFILACCWWWSSGNSRSQQEFKAIYPSALWTICAVLMSVIFCSSMADRLSSSKTYSFDVTSWR